MPAIVATPGMSGGCPDPVACAAVAVRVRETLRATSVTDGYRAALAAALTVPGNILSDTADGRWARLVWTCCAAAGGSPEDATPAAAATEVFMVGLDVLDDAEDGEQTALHAALGSARALNVSTGLLLLAQRSLLALPAGPTLIGILLDAGMRACAGQHADLAPATEHGHALDAALDVAAGKSASLVAALCQVGAACAGADGGAQGRYAHFGRLLGMALQLDNDIAAVRPGAVGKTDLALGRPTLPLACAAALVAGGGAPSGPALAEAALVAQAVAETYRQHAVDLVPALCGDPDGQVALRGLLRRHGGALPRAGDGLGAVREIGRRGVRG